MEKVAEVLGLKYPQFNTVSPTSNIQDALYKMSCENVEYLIVMEDQKFLGILTEHDIANKILFNKMPLNEILVSDFMSTRLPIVNINDSLEDCMQILERDNVHYIAVYDRFNYKGVVSFYDIMQQVLRKRKDTVEVTVEQESYSWIY